MGVVYRRTASFNPPPCFSKAPYFFLKRGIFFRGAHFLTRADFVDDSANRFYRQPTNQVSVPTHPRTTKMNKYTFIQNSAPFSTPPNIDTPGGYIFYQRKTPLFRGGWALIQEVVDGHLDSTEALIGASGIDLCS